MIDIYVILANRQAYRFAGEINVSITLLTYNHGAHNMIVLKSK